MVNNPYYPPIGNNIHYKYQATPSVKGTQHIRPLSSLSFLSERNLLRHRSGYGRSPCRPFFFLVLFKDKSHIQSLQKRLASVQVRPKDPNKIQPSPVEKRHHQLAPSVGTTVPLQIKLITQLLMVSTRNTSS